MQLTPLTDPASIRRVVDAWVAEQTGTLAGTDLFALDAELPDWRAQATLLISQGLLAYVAMEMVIPDLASGSGTEAHSHSGNACNHPHGEHDFPDYEVDSNHDHDHGHHDDAELSARLGAHLRDFVDYRDELDELRRMTASPVDITHSH